jgi:thioredoxin-related protein
MKKLLVLFFVIFIFSSINLTAQEADTAEAAVPDTISWFTNYDSAVTVANDESRYMLILFYTDW